MQDSDGPPRPDTGRAWLPSVRLYLAREAGRNAMSKNIYVGNLPFDITSDDLRDWFAEHGAVTRAQVATDRDTGRSRGFGFVEMSQGGEEAMAALDGAQVGGRTLKVNEARPREDRARSGEYDRPRSAGSSSGRRW
jgi:RNA recognition motif-containing protein